MKKTIFNVRKFLNSSCYHSTAFIFARLTKSIIKGSKNKKTGKRGKDRFWYDAELKIADCDRMINLSIDTYNKISTKNTVRKLDILINVLKEFRKAFSKEMEATNKNKQLIKDFL